MSFFFVCCHLAAMVRQRHHYFCIYTSAIRNFFPRSIPKNKVFAKTQFQSSCIMSTANAKHLDIYLKFEKNVSREVRWLRYLSRGMASLWQFTSRDAQTNMELCSRILIERNLHNAIQKFKSISFQSPRSDIERNAKRCLNTFFG